MKNSMKKLAIASILIASPLLWLLNNQVSATPKQMIPESIISSCSTKR